jgi:tRNA/rRNA methyltransferase
MDLNNITIILVKTQMGENIGAAARIMKNFGIHDLRIISPRDGWPSPKAHEMSAHADDIIENAKLFDDIEDAVADLNVVFATASKPRDMAKQVITPEKAANIADTYNNKIGIIFGKESSGLENEDISHANYLISIPVSKNYDSLNIAQAVCVVCYEMFKLGTISPVSELPDSSIPIPERKDINDMVNFLDKELSDRNFFQVPEKKPGMLINIRNIFTRHFYTEQEVRTLRGIFNALKK